MDQDLSKFDPVVRRFCTLAYQTRYTRIGVLSSGSRGYDLGKANNRYLAARFGREEFAGARELGCLHDSGSRLTVQHATDFVIEEDGVRKNVKLQDRQGPVVRSRTSVRRRLRPMPRPYRRFR